MEGRRTRTRPKRYEEKEKSLSVTGQTSIPQPPGKRGSSSQMSTASTVRTSPTRTRRSSRPRSSASSATVTITPVIPPSPIKELKEPKSSPKQQQRIGSRAATNKTPPTVTTTNITTATTISPTTTTTTTPPPSSNIQSGISNPTTITSVHSTYSSTTTQKTVTEIRGPRGSGGGIIGGIGGIGGGLFDSEISKFTDFIRRSVSRRGSSREGSHTPTTNTEAETHSRYSRSASRSLYDDDRYSKAEFSDNEGAKLDDIEEEDDDFDGSDVQYKSFSSYNTNVPQHVLRTATSSSVLLCRKLAAPQEFGGRWGALLLLVLAPTLVYYLQWCCNNKAAACTLRRPNVLGALDVQYLLQRVFPLPAVGAYVAAVLSVFMLSALLPGKHVRLPLDRGNITYKFNAPAMAVLLTIGLAIAQQLKYPVVDFVLRHYLRFCIYGLLNTFIVALWAYARSGEWWTRKLQTHGGNDKDVLFNEYGKTGHWVIDYAQGRQINPKWLGIVELKLVFYRLAWLSALLYAQCFIYRTLNWPAGLPAALAEALATPSPLASAQQIWLAVQQHAARVQFDAASLLTAGMLLLYSGDALIFEHHLASSFELQGEGFGCLLLLRYAATPYMLSGIARHFHDKQPNAPIGCQWAAYAPIALLIAGLILKRFSNAIKYQYRIKPLLPIFAGIETIHTFQGRRLLCGALWGRLRQPNYAGDIAALVALALPLALRFVWPPLLGLLLCIAILLHRTARVNSRNLARYHSSWVRYCAQVRNYILPKVY